MPILQNYTAFDGRHWETGTVANALAHQGVQAPHTGEAPSEALLMGVSGGATFGYFTFDYEGYDPILALLSRNTFDPMTTFLERLAIPHDYKQTTTARKAEENLYAALDNGEVPIVWADKISLPYNAFEPDDNNWDMVPIVVYGVADEVAYIADRSKQGLQVAWDELTDARGRIKKDKYRILTVSAPNWDYLPAAVTKGIWQCIQLYTEAPPKGSAKNFGFAAYQHWATMLTNTRNKQSWARYFPAGSRLMAGLTSVAWWSLTWGTGNGMERELYADFLDEAALILDKPDLGNVGKRFRDSAEAWRELAEIALPAAVEPLAEAGKLTRAIHELFIEYGQEHLTQIQQAKAVLAKIKADVAQDFPLSGTEISQLMEKLQTQVLHIHDIEKQAIDDLQVVMS